MMLLIASCAHSHEGLYPATSPRLASRLGIAEGDWREIQALIKLEKDENSKNYELVYLECYHLGYIGAWMAHKTPNERRPHGPIFFYAKAGGRWYRSEDMSEWGNE
jgi:hypothetical protein